ncbi:hypothetical protein F5Y07DRAFT_162130 [Xylaria sp. FL0933]|nr:hypothetical protein F5Y07DRAFT_162130 [Xylaria sp. FL0933]
MGTRGYYIYKWQGRHYVYYNHWDSYPEGLGRKKVGEIPTDPTQYQAWLEQKRAFYSELAKKLFAVSWNEFERDLDLEKEEGWPDLEDQFPCYLCHQGDLFIEWVYVFDLDREMFGIHGSAFYHLDKIRVDFENTLEEAQNFWLGKIDQNQVHESITTNDVPPTSLAHDPTPAFIQMKPTTVYPKRESRLNRMPAFVACKALFELLPVYYEQHIYQAQNSHVESDFLFRELVFALMCFASCSPAWVRFVHTDNILDKLSASNEQYCGAILDHGNPRKPKEFLTRFLLGYHLEDREPGSAPKSTSYWFSGALVYLRRDITSREMFYDAIVSAVAKGKADGKTHFSAIIISLKHFVLLKFVDGNVQHTKRFKLRLCPDYVKVPALVFVRSDCEEESLERIPAERETEEKTTEEEKDSPDNSDWADNTRVPAFEILAHFFDATQKQQLKPSNIYNEGVFPNEVYQRILGYVDGETNIACLNVSRVFREFASETWVVDKGLRLVYCPGKEPQCRLDETGPVGPFSIMGNGNPDNPGNWGFELKPRALRHQQASSPSSSHPPTSSRWLPVFGRPDGSASWEPAFLLSH